MIVVLASYLAFVAVCLVAPGLALQRRLRLALDPALVLPIGIAWTAGAFWLGAVCQSAWLFPVAIAVPFIAFVAPGPPLRLAQGPSLRGALPPFLTVVALLALTQYPWNRRAASGEFLLDNLVPFDTAFHVGLTHELTLGYPPQLPGVAGFPLGYHLGTDLVRAAALRWAAIDPYDSISRLDVTLGALALLLALRAAARMAGAGPLALALASWSLLATDLSIVFAANTQAHWWADLLRGNLLLSLALSNPIVPALALALGSLVALSRHDAGEGRGWLALAAALAAAVPFFKVFLGAHLVLGLFAAAVLVPAASRRALAWTALPCAVATAALALGQGGQTLEVVLAPLDLVQVTRETLGLPPLAGTPLLLFGLAWIVASLGVRIFGLPAAFSALRGPSAAASALAAMALAGWPLGLLFRVSAPEALPGQRIVNDAAYIVEQSGPLLWVFAALALGGAVGAATSSPRARLLVGVAAALSLPATLQFVVKKHRLAPDPLPAPMVRAIDALARHSVRGDLVLQRPGARFPPAPVILIGRRVAYERFTPYLTQFASVSDLQARHAQVYRFFQTSSADEALGIAERLGARFVCLYGRDRVRFPTQGVLEPIHEEAGASCWRIAGGVGGRR